MTQRTAFRNLIGALLLAATIGAGAATSRSGQETDLWNALRNGGHVILLRHAATELGIGDPPGFRLDDCRTQRNLSEAGRAQSRAWGRTFMQRGIPVGGVFSSAWCRCVDTARLAFGRVETWPALNSHFESPASAELQAEQLRGGIPVRMQAGRNLVLVTHQVNITAVSGVTPMMGEAVVMRVQGAALQLVGRLQAPEPVVAPAR